MANSFVQLPYTATTSGQLMDSAQITVGANVVQRERLVIADDATAAALAPVTSSGGLLVSVSSGTINIVNTYGASVILGQTISASSGLVQTLSSGPVLLSSAGITQIIPVTSSGVNLYTTAGVNTVSASSGLVQTLSSGPILLSSGGITQIIPVTSSGINL